MLSQRIKDYVNIVLANLTEETWCLDLGTTTCQLTKVSKGSITSVNLYNDRTTTRSAVFIDPASCT